MCRLILFVQASRRSRVARKSRGLEGPTPECSDRNQERKREREREEEERSWPVLPARRDFQQSRREESEASIHKAKGAKSVLSLPIARRSLRLPVRAHFLSSSYQNERRQRCRLEPELLPCCGAEEQKRGGLRTGIGAKNSSERCCLSSSHDDGDDEEEKLDPDLLGRHRRARRLRGTPGQPLFPR